VVSEIRKPEQPPSVTNQSPVSSTGMTRNFVGVTLPEGEVRIETALWRTTPQVGDGGGDKAGT
jgi:hypothetical protein